HEIRILHAQHRPAQNTALLVAGLVLRRNLWSSRKRMTSPLLRVEGVTLQYQTAQRLVQAAYRVSFDVLRSDRFVILGPSGCGKSTILKAVGGYVQPVEGRILLDEKPVSAPGPDRVFVFQEFDQLLPWKTVRENIVFALMAGKGHSRSEAMDRSMHFLEK